MREIYAMTWRGVRAFWLHYLVVGVAVAVLSLFFRTYTAHQIGGTLAGIPLALWIHRYLLLGETQPLATITEWQTPALGPFIAATLMVFLLVVLLGIGVARYLPLHAALSGYKPALALLLACVVVLPFIGTALPAAASGDSWGVQASLGRTRATFLPILGGLVLGSGLIFLGCIAVWILVFSAFYFYAPTSWVHIPIALVRAALSVMIFSMSALFTTSAIAVLCRAYRRATPP